ncbi:MAG: hypothetical protein ACYC2T_06855 [Bacillota bacterium]
MITIFWLGVALMVAFSVGVALYLTNYRLALASPVGRLVSVAALGTAVFVLTFVLMVMVVWPPQWPL